MTRFAFVQFAKPDLSSLKVVFSDPFVQNHGRFTHAGTCSASLSDSAGSRLCPEASGFPFNYWRPSMTRSLIHCRTTAFSRQSGRCYYCELPMWQDNPVEFAAKYRITSGQARSLRCTAEHIVARQDGGSNSRSNIVAACWVCNSRRHRRKVAPSPELYKQHVRRRINQGRWHQT